jgi:uncharacterized membrane protein
MRTRLSTWLEQLRGTYWLVPGLMLFLATVLSIVTIALDDRIWRAGTSAPSWLLIADPNGARTFLTTVAGSMITTAGVTFSITIATFAQASSQYGPRLLNNFMRDRGNQIVLGTFVATFVYCLLILRVVRSGNQANFIPHLSLLTAFGLTIASVVVLIYFFHHVSTSIRAEYIIGHIGHDLEAAIERLFPEQLRMSWFEQGLRSEDDIPSSFNDEARPVPAAASGYLQAIDYEALFRIARKRDLLVRMMCRPGDFIALESPLALIWPPDRMEDELIEAIKEAIVIGLQRLGVQDVEYALNQLVEIAVRALSPGINDPFTAMQCVDQIGTSLAQLAERRIPRGYHYDGEERLRLIRDTATFRGILDQGFDQIRQYGRGSAPVTIRQLEALAVIAAHAQNDSQREAVSRQAELIKSGADETIPTEYDRQAVAARYTAVLHALRPDAKPQDALPDAG